AAVGNAERLFGLEAFGAAALEPEQAPMAPDTLFDLASLTKVVATTPAVLHLLEAGAFSLETPVADLLPVFADRRVTVRHLLTHTSGLPAWMPLYLDCSGLAEYAAAIGATPLVRASGTQVEYSDLGFILLGAMVERLSETALPDFCREAIFAPLGMAHTTWSPKGPRSGIAATEKGNQTEYGMCGERAASFGRWRHEVLWGEVNDGNAWYGLGGISGHAGLFSTAGDLARYAQAWLNGGGPILSQHTVALAARSHTAGKPENRGLGWQKPAHVPFPPKSVSCGDLMSPAAFGHTGFTGTSLWIDPEKDLFAVLLTNRLHPVTVPRSADLMAIRPAFHNAVVASIT
ncbi:MAG TPA: serine hydrolase domain-containing protein, partial [Symbiobacteriaceae bacterium]|nr:serine hydrolase domain-containing protein [Symbiobacteriaceae bacterium]